MKTIILGDIHARNIWKRILKNESVTKDDTVIFLGDYFDTFGPETPSMQVENFVEILDFADECPDNRILLIGNHDYHYLANHFHYSGYNDLTNSFLEPYKNRMIDTLKVTYYDKQHNILFSHAGVSKYWLNNVAHLNTIQELDRITPLSPELEWNEIFGFEWHGDTVSNSPIWIRPDSLLRSWPTWPDKDLTQVVGHTETNSVRFKHIKEGTLFQCDCIEKQYLVIENDEFIIKTNNF